MSPCESRWLRKGLTIFYLEGELGFFKIKQFFSVVIYQKFSWLLFPADLFLALKQFFAFENKFSMLSPSTKMEKSVPKDPSNR